MGKKRIFSVADRLTVYAVERQGFERYQAKGAPPWREQRRFWTDAILQGMARLEGLTPDPGLMEQFDRRLENAHGCAAAETLPLKEQIVLMRDLSRYVSALETAGGDRRRQVDVIRELLEDMVTHRNWNPAENGISPVRNQVESALVRMTAQMPIRFTRIALGGDAGPHWASGFASGCAIDEESVKRTPVYQKAIRDYPEIRDWPALCTVYVGRDLPSAFGTVDACEFDLEIMNRTGDRFLNERGVSCVGGPYQITVSAPVMSLEEPASPQMGLTM